MFCTRPVLFGYNIKKGIDMIDWLKRIKLQVWIIITLVVLVYLPTFVWMKYRFLQDESNYSHGFLIPVVSLFLIWRMREEFKEVISFDSGTASINGLWIFIIGLFLHLFSRCFMIDFISGFSLIIVIFGLCLYLLGPAITKKLIFPIGFLIFMVPIPETFTISLTFYLKMLATYCATKVINLLGIGAIMDGARIYLSNNEFFEIGAPCSGIRSLITFLMLGSIFAYLLPISHLRKYALVVLTIPLAILSNVVRIVFIGIVTYIYGKEMALQEPNHTILGLLVFVVGIIGLVVLGRILSWK